MASSLLFAILLALSSVIAIAAMLWIIINARAVVRIFARPDNDLALGPRLVSPPMRRSVWAAILLFNLGWIGAVAIWTLGIVKVNDPPATAENRPVMPRSVPSH
jgi:hypothetical protein